LKPLDFPLLADENIHSDVISFLRETGSDVESVAEQGTYGISDTQVLQHATETDRVVLTHDSDFGGLALMGAEFIGIIYIRPGHIRTDFTMKTLQAVRENAPDVTPPFILVAERTGGTVKIRVRQL